MTFSPPKVEKPSGNAPLAATPWPSRRVFTKPSLLMPMAIALRTAVSCMMGLVMFMEPKKAREVWMAEN